MRAANLLPALILALVVLLLAGPQRPGEQGQERELTNIELCLDLSGSMTSPFGEGSRYDAAMRAIDGFCKTRRGDAFGLTVFGNEVLRWTPLTRDLNAIAEATPWLRPENMPDQFGGTQIAKALEACLLTVGQRPDGDRMVILVSDGLSGDFSEGRAEGLARDFAAAGVVLYMVFVGAMRVRTRACGSSLQPAAARSSRLATSWRWPPASPASTPCVRPRSNRWRRRRRICAPPVALAAALLLALHALCLFGLRWTPW